MLPGAPGRTEGGQQGTSPRVADDQGWTLPRNRHSRPTRNCATGIACCQGGPSLWRQPWPLQDLQKAEAAGEAEAAVLLGRMYLQGDGVAKDTGLALQGLRRTILVTPVSARRARAQMLQSKDTADA